MRSLSLNSLVVCHQYDHRTLEMTLDVPRLRTSGSYSLTGKVLNIEGLDSQGPYRSVIYTAILSVLGQVVRYISRNEYSDITATGQGERVNRSV